MTTAPQKTVAANSPVIQRSLAGTTLTMMDRVPRKTRKKRLTWRAVLV